MQKLLFLFLTLAFFSVVSVANAQQPSTAPQQQQGLSPAKCSVNGKEVPCEEALRQLKNFAGIGLGLVALIGGIILVGGLFWILMLVHAITKPIENKGMWIFLLFLTSTVGALVYFFAVKRKFNKSVSAPLPQT